MGENMSAGDFIQSMEERLRPPHKCEPIARVPPDLMDEGRDWWIGKLTERHPEWKGETHCLHIKTPLKEVWFLIWEGDMQWIAALGHAAFGPISLEWLDRTAASARKVVNESRMVKVWCANCQWTGRRDRHGTRKWPRKCIKCGWTGTVKQIEPTWRGR